MKSVTWMIPLSITVLMFFLASIPPYRGYTYGSKDADKPFIAALVISVVAWYWWYQV